MNKTKPINNPCRKITLEERENSTPVNVTDYKSIIGALLFVSTKTRPDISFAVNQAARHAENPTEVDLKSALMILRYLKSTKEKSIYYYGSKNLIAYSDADFAGDEETRKSTSGYIFLFGKSPISWKSETQKSITLSTTEAEYVALTECAKQGMKLKKLLKEIFNKEINLKIKVDNKSCKNITENENTKGRCKHMDIDYKYIQEKINRKEMNLEHISSDTMLADPLTKVISGPKMKCFTDCNALVTYSNRQHWKINNKLKCFFKKFCFINLLK